MRTLYLDCFSGLSGNMFLAAMLELGVDYDYLKKELGKLHLEDEFELELSKMDKNGIVCNYLDVILKKEEHDHSHHHDHGHSHNHCHDHTHSHDHSHEHCHSHEHDHHHDHEECHHHGHEHNHVHGHCHSHDHHHDHHHDHDHHHHSHEHDHHHHHSHDHHVHRNLYDVHSIIEKNDLSARVQEMAKSIFGFVAAAESKVHGKPIEEVHFHEVGAIDSIVDIVGAAICIDYLGIERVIASPVATGTGFVKCAHGLMPLPAPATIEIIKDARIPFYSADVKGELLTPTGAAILAAFVSEYGTLPQNQVVAIGYGAGKRDNAIPNVVRAYLLEEISSEVRNNEVMEIRFQVDDMTGEELGFFMELAFEAGAKDVYYQPIYMKKNRPGTEVVLLIEPSNAHQFSELIFKHTSTLGFRYLIWPRQEMNRQSFESDLNGEKYHVKIAEWNNVQKISYEYEDIKRIALAQNKTLQEILNEISFSVFQSIQNQKKEWKDQE